MSDMSEADDEVKRLRAERDEARAEAARLRLTIAERRDSILELEAEVARLRFALTKVARSGRGHALAAKRNDGHSCAWCRGMLAPCPSDIADEALEPRRWVE